MQKERAQKRKFLFNIDVLIEEESNGRALEVLLHLLNTESVSDYNIKEGVELGKKIESALKEAISKKGKDAPDKPSANERVQTAPAAEKTAGRKGGTVDPNFDPNGLIWEKLKSFQQYNTLIRLSVNRGRGVKLSIPCRIISTDPPGGTLTVYHVDEKKVYLLTINEIDDFGV